MNFRTEIKLNKSSHLIEHNNKIAAFGSCFAENIADYLQKYRFSMLNNPFGVLYNPVSIHNAFTLIVTEKKFRREDLIQHDNLWHSWYHHSSFSNQDPDKCLANINKNLISAKNILSGCDFLIITYGTAYVYKHIDSGLIVSNCHKIPAEQFNRFRLELSNIVKNISETIGLVQQLNPSIQIIFSISPIRHLKDGLVENQLSKSSLITALHETIRNFKSCSYFPAYEIMMDDLRDYRYYEPNLTHPNQTAIEYIWDKFNTSWLSQGCQSVIQDLHRLNLARSHRSLFPGSGQEKVFIQNQLKIIAGLKKKYEYIDFTEDLDFFKSRLNDRMS